MYAEQPLHHFLDKLCSNSPEPGGGSASALVGAIGAGLCGMLAALTINKKGYESVQDEVSSIHKNAERFKNELLELLQRDTEAFDDAAKAFKLPKSTTEEKKKREIAIDAGLKKATEVPLAIMEKCLEVSRLAMHVLKIGNTMAISDGAIAAIFSESAIIGGMLNVRINFTWMKDKIYIVKTEGRLDAILAEAKRIKEEALTYTLKKLMKQAQ